MPTLARLFLMFRRDVLRHDACHVSPDAASRFEAAFFHFLPFAAFRLPPRYVVTYYFSIFCYMPR